MEPEPIIPRPPELLTALANFQPLHQIIPAWIIGYLIPNNSITLFSFNFYIFSLK